MADFVSVAKVFAAMYNCTYVVPQSEIQKEKKISNGEFDDDDIDYAHNDASDDDCADNDCAQGSDDSNFQGLTVTTDEGGKVTILD